MNDETGLPDDVVAEIHANRKIEAIKRLREHRGIGLKDAKEAVDRYISQLPQSAIRPSQRADSGLGRLLFVGAGAVAIYLMYNYFSAGGS
jgi:hypothetical protein